VLVGLAVALLLIAQIAELVARLIATAAAVDDTGRRIVDGGQDLTAVAQELAASLRVFRAVLPRQLDGLDTVEHLEGAVETMTETVEPLAGAAEGVGRFTRKLTRRGSED
jgi:hypothetical protein